MLDVYVHNHLSVKHFHGISSGNPHPYSLKSRYGKVRKEEIVGSEKQLEYRLVDLMSDAHGNQDVVDAIMKIVVFLKTRDATPAK
jgi:hypothetical protein